MARPDDLDTEPGTAPTGAAADQGSPDTAPGKGSAELLEALEALAADPTRLASLAPDELARLQQAAGRIAFPSRTQRRKVNRHRRTARRQEVRNQTEAALETASNRALKRALRFPTAPPELKVSAADRELLERQAEGARVAEGDEAQKLAEPRNCYICKRDYDVVHHHYDSMCPACADLNWHKRHQTADLTGRVALVTGSRVKIGYEAALKLLRSGATVVATTRFPCDSAKRFAREPDFATFADRLHIHGLELRHTPSVERFAEHLLRSLPRLDFLVHNACQTVRRPPAYYRHLVEREQPESLPEPARRLLDDHAGLVAQLVTQKGNTPDGRAADPALVPETGAGEDHGGLRRAPALTQLDLLAEAHQAHLFPDGMLDGEGQQLDLRGLNSWRMELADVPTVELLEVQLVNSIAPYVLTARLKPVMLRAGSADKHVVNVSAMEGQFYRTFKTTKHPHTNMAKAALNMMTRTSAAEFVREGIHMNSVDTGWVTDEDPFAKSVEKAAEQGFTPPLDSVDGAARVLDPIFTGFLTGVHCWGQFLKDYRPTRW